MTKNKKRIFENQLLIKKLKIFEKFFRFPGIYPMEGEKMKKIIFWRRFSNFRGFYLMKGEQNERID